jgi:hypothetical protein
MMGNQDCRLPQERERLQQARPDPRMILDNDVGVRIKHSTAGPEMIRKHQESDVMKQGGKFEMVKRSDIKPQLQSDPAGDEGGLSRVPRLPWQSTVEFAGDLTDQNAFEISSRGYREPEAVDFSKQPLNLQNDRINLV